MSRNDGEEKEKRVAMEFVCEGMRRKSRGVRGM